MKMHKGVLERVKMLERKNGIRYLDTDSTVYKVFKIVLIVVFIYAMLVNLLYSVSMLLNSEELAETFYRYILTPVICSVLMLLGLIFEVKKFHITGGILSVIPATVLAIFFKTISYGVEANSLQARYYWRHLAPMVLIVVSASVMSIIGVGAKTKLQKMYNKVTKNIYETYKVNLTSGGEISSEQWEEFLENFDPADYQAQFLKTRENEDASEK